jgi:hypothetical protein
MRRVLFVILGLCLLAPASAAYAADHHEQLYSDCQDGRVNGKYSQSDYRRALANIPADVDEYTDCRDVIRRGQLAAAGGGGGSGTGGGDTGAGGGGAAGGGSAGGGGGGGGTAGGVRVDPLANATPHERKAVERLQRSDAGKPVEVGGKLITPQALTKGVLSGDNHNLPTPLIVLLGLLAVAALAAGGSVAWSRVVARRSAG